MQISLRYACSQLAILTAWFWFLGKIGASCRTSDTLMLLMGRRQIRVTDSGEPRIKIYIWRTCGSMAAYWRKTEMHYGVSPAGPYLRFCDHGAKSKIRLNF